MAIEDLAAQGLCGVMEKALIGQGIDPAVAKVLAERACQPAVKSATRSAKKTVKRKASAYSKKYSRAFKKVASKYKKKNGGWKAGGFKSAQAAAHKLAKKMR